MRRLVRLLYPLAIVVAFLLTPLAAAAAQPFPVPPGGPQLKNFERLRAAMVATKKHTERLMNIKGVVATATGMDPGGTPVIKVMTADASVTGIPKILDGFPVHVSVTGRIYARNHIPVNTSPAGPWDRPVPIGVSTGHPDITAGTIGARVTNGTTVFALSNNHVYANVNSASIGDNVLQPGPYDEGVNPTDAIGTLADFEPIRFCTVLLIWLVCQENNQIDAAIAATDETKVGFATPPGGYGTPSSVIHAAYGNPTVIGDETLDQLVGASVSKFGRTTGATTGTIDSINATVQVCYDQACSLIAQFADQIIITPGTFSGGGDSGSLIVTTNGNNPVGLLFAGSDTITIANRIDLVLNRFAVTIDDGGATAQVTDVATQGISITGTPVVGQSTGVSVTVRNVGNEDVTESFSVTLKITSPTGNVKSGTHQVSGLAAGASIDLPFAWTPDENGAHTLQASHDLGSVGSASPPDADSANDTYTLTDVNVLETPVAGPGLQLWDGPVSTDDWTTVTLSQDYGNEMVVVCTPSYDISGLGPTMARVRNASGTSFQVGLARPWYGAFTGDHWSTDVHCMVVRAGVYTQAEHGVKMEAVKLENFTRTDNSGSWVGERQSYTNSYSTPVVLGQVISNTTDIPGSVTDWSVFWSRGRRATQPPSSNSLYVGRHTGQDPRARPAETIAYIVIEAGTGTMDGHGYSAGLGPDSVRGVSNNPPYSYGLTGLSTASTAILSSAGMDGREGGWPILYGSNPVTATQLRMAIEEDWYWDSERGHTTEQVNYIVFE